MKTGSKFFILITLLLPFIYSCGSGEKKEPVRKEVSAKTYMVIKDTALLTRRFPGQVEAKNQIVLSSKISGIVTSLPVEEGNKVKKGDHLITIDDRELKKKLEGLKATLESATRDRESIAAQTAYAKANYKRFSQLLREEAATQEEFDRAKSEYDSRAKQELSLVAREKAVTAQIAEIKVLLSYAEITSPVEGLVIKRYVDQGAFVSAAQPLIALDDGNTGFWFVAEVDESFLKDAQKTTAVQISIPSLGIDLVKSLSIIVPHVNSSTRTFTVKADITGHEVRSGEYGSLYWPIGETEKLLIPASAIIRRGDLTAVYAVDENRVIHFRLIKTGSYFSKSMQRDKKQFSLFDPDSMKLNDNKQDLWVEILSGLSPNEVIVISDVQTISEGDVLK